jgi:hypothetical protein
MDFFLKIPVGKDPGNLQVHPCSALDERPAFAYLIEDYEFLPGMLKVGYACQSPCSQIYCPLIIQIYL